MGIIDPTANIPAPIPKKREVLKDFWIAVDEAYTLRGISMEATYSQQAPKIVGKSPSLPGKVRDPTEIAKDFNEYSRKRKQKINLAHSHPGDVNIYLILNAANLILGKPWTTMGFVGCDETEVEERLKKVPARTYYSQFFRANADFRFFGIAAGYVEDTSRRRGEAQDFYGEAYHQYTFRQGQFKAIPVLLRKISQGFEGYLNLAKDAFNLARLKPLPINKRIETLLEKLKKEDKKYKADILREELRVLIRQPKK